MAITKKITTIHGIELPAAYIRVESVGVATKTSIAFNVCVYADKEKPMVDGYALECAYDMKGGNPIAQAYEHLKTLPDFADAVDC